MKRSGSLARTSGLKRGSGPKRTAMRRTVVERDWSAARAKLAAEGSRCRVCGSSPVQAAHTVGRAHDPKHPDGSGRRVVLADLVVPLCEPCHLAYDAHELDLRPFLTGAEREAAEAARPGSERRLAGAAWRGEAA